ncbi:MAG: zinc ABC transporter substrate-binding protein [Thermodesulfobacteriota bacterium]
MKRCALVSLIVCAALILPLPHHFLPVIQAEAGIQALNGSGHRLDSGLHRSEVPKAVLAQVQARLAGEVVVASTSLTAAIATAAGAKDVRVMTPQGLKHPPEYELRPSDLLRFEGAKVVVYGGYERMVSKLLETSRSQGLQAVQVNTEGSPENLIEQVRKTARVLKTEEKALAWEKGFTQALSALRSKIAHLSGKRAVVHRFAEPFARWAGLGVAQIIRPGEITPRAIAEAIAQSPEVVVDVLHFPLAKVIAENAGCRYVQIINFPGVDNTNTLEDLFKYNTAQLLRGFQ